MTIDAGISLRDWFAAQAMSALISPNDSHANFEDYAADWGEDIASGAYRIADAMLAERSEGTFK